MDMGAVKAVHTGNLIRVILYAKWIKAFSSTFPNVTINYDAVGSDEGVARFIGQTVDFAGCVYRKLDSTIVVMKAAKDGRRYEAALSLLKSPQG